MAALPRIKNTPPLTPRALSNDGVESIKKLPLHSSSHHLPDILNTDPQVDKISLVSANTSPVPNASAPVGPQRGRLVVNIAGARGIRPSYDPYAVCVFEWNESIARGAKSDGVDLDKDEGKEIEDFSSGIPINRSSSDMGRSIAIPMKSRQGSTASLSDCKVSKSGRQTTDPRWEHEATLYVNLPSADLSA